MVDGQPGNRAASAATPHEATLRACRLCRSDDLRRLASGTGMVVFECARCGTGQGAFTGPDTADTGQFDRLYTEAMRDDKADDCWRLLRSALDDVAGRRILDIGCGRGAFLDHAAEAGMHTTGLEPAAEAHQIAAARHDVIASPIDDPTLSLPPSSFDVVTMWDVLEHLRDPRTALRVAVDALARGGLLIIVTPAMGTVFDRLAIVTNRVSAGRARRLLNMCWTREHLSRFDAEGLRRQAVSFGCSRVDVRSILLLSLQSDRYSSGGLLPAWTRSTRLNRLISVAGVAVAERAQLHNKLLLEARK